LGVFRGVLFAAGLFAVAVLTDGLASVVCTDASHIVVVVG
jgi:hypothetical protein